MIIHKKVTPGLAIFSYLVMDLKTGKAAAIDPARDIEEFVDIAKQNDVTITDILETHVHADFVSGAKELKARLGGKPTIHCSGMGGEAWTPKYADRVLSNGDEVILGDIRLRAVHTPGHTPEHIMWEMFDDTRSKDSPWILFTGDLLFVGDVGRPDLLGPYEQESLMHQLYHSLFTILLSYPDGVEIFPAHGSGSLCGKAIGGKDTSTLGYERLFNPSLKKMPEKEWGEKLLRNMPEAPPYFKKMKKINVVGPEILGNPMDRLKPYTPEELNALDLTEISLVDTRSKESFLAMHIDNAFNVPATPSLSTYGGNFLSYEKPIILIVTEKTKLPEIVTQFMRVGFDDIIGYLDGGIGAWEESGLKLSGTETIGVEELSKKLSDEARLKVIDVRTIGEWSEGHVPDALHIPFAVFLEKIDTIPKDSPLAIICASGHRASIVASILKAHGITNVRNVTGGMIAWNNAKLPVETSTQGV